MKEAGLTNGGFYRHFDFCSDLWRARRVTLLAAGILKDIGGRIGGQGPVEPEVQLGDAGGRCDP
jgi:hypothetical protein